MQQHFFSRAALAAVVILTISAPGMRAEDEIPTAPSGSLEARTGRPPGSTDSVEPRMYRGLPSDVDSTSYAMRDQEARTGRQARKQPSFWAEFVSWLEEQALRVASRP